MPAQRNIEIWKGNTFERVFVLLNGDRTPAQMAGSEFVFRLVWQGGELRKTVGDGLSLDPATGRLALVVKPAETRLLPTGSYAVKYELERRVGDWQGTLLYGSVTVKEWANDD
ncbi:hypothetical protein BA190_10205 [Labrys sp. WJW]|uniref:hypothetical protein n=1 Tax=Labrys sp. WJW TaxID=1737983 RepID=UPI000832C1EA|nr:hypothetical protein [Labrys sp. WJW]OCC05266.1 hypothetical protein BA190_10205 [Labrys sp. WJW]